MKTCSKCTLSLSLECFSVTKRDITGAPLYYNSWCNSCRTAQNRERLGRCKRPKPLEEVGKKQCLHCQSLLPLEQFSASKRGRGGKSAYCRPCQSERYRDAGKSREATARYRLKNSERWKSLHRLHQFKRRHKIEATSDGTVTDEILLQIYNTPLCFWCKEETPQKDRTLEHITELCSGGKHTEDNVTMACKSCNSRRLNRDGTYRR